MSATGPSPSPAPAAQATAPRAVLRAVAVLGIVVSLLLLPVTILGQTVVTDQVGATAETVDARLAQGIPLVESAATAVLDEVEAFSDAYAWFRASYQATTDTLSAAVDGVEAIATVLPGGVASGLHAALSGLEDRVQ